MNRLYSAFLNSYGILVAIVQIFAIAKDFQASEWGTFGSYFMGFLCTGIPGLGAYYATNGAVYAWGWSTFWAAVFFFGPLVLWLLGWLWMKCMQLQFLCSMYAAYKQGQFDEDGESDDDDSEEEDDDDEEDDEDDDDGESTLVPAKEFFKDDDDDPKPSK